MLKTTLLFFLSKLGYLKVQQQKSLKRNTSLALTREQQTWEQGEENAAVVSNVFISADRQRPTHINHEGI